MKLIVISNPTDLINEQEIVCSLFEAGLECFHVRKPAFSKEGIQKYIRRFSSIHQNKIFIHDEFLKFHSIEEMEKNNKKYEYAFLSPVFDSISKEGYKSKFDLNELKSSLLFRKETKGEVYALGGIDEDKIEIINELGF